MYVKITNQKVINFTNIKKHFC